MEKQELTPMMKQYLDLKKKHPDAILLFRCGDFYETYKTDAEDCARILGITLTKSMKQKDDEGRDLAMAGFPYHALDTYLPKLIRAGKRVAICDQIEAPKQTLQNTEEKTEEKPKKKPERKKKSGKMSTTSDNDDERTTTRVGQESTADANFTEKFAEPEVMTLGELIKTYRTLVKENADLRKELQEQDEKQRAERQQMEQHADEALRAMTERAMEAESRLNDIYQAMTGYKPSK